MPTVPSYNDIGGTYTGPRVETAPLKPDYGRPSPDASTAFGAAEGKALRGVGQQVSEIGGRLGEITRELQVQENEFQVKKADVALSEGYRVLLYGDGTPENPGYHSLNGEDAVKALPALNSRMTELRQQVTEGVEGDRAKIMFSEYSASKEQTAKSAAAVHSLKQGEVAKQAVDLARVDNAVSSAATSFKDPIALATYAAVAENAGKSAAARRSQDPAVLERAAVVARTEVYKAAIIGAIKGEDIAEAQRLFDLHKGKMDGVVASDVARTLSAGMDREASQNAVDSVMALGMPEEQALQFARENFSGRQEDDIVSRISTRYEAQRRARNEQDKAIVSSLFGAINAPGDKAVPLDVWATQNPEEFARVAQDPETYKAAVAADNARQLGESFARVTDVDTYAALRNMGADELAETDLVPLMGKLSRKDYDILVTKKDAAIKSLTATGGNKTLYVSGRQALDRFAPKDSEGKAVLTDAQMNTIELEMTTWIESQTQRGVKVAEPDIVRKAQSFMLPLIQERVGMFGGVARKTVGAVGAPMTEEPNRPLKLRADGIPMTAAEITDAVQRLTTKGFEVSPANIEQLVAGLRKTKKASTSSNGVK